MATPSDEARSRPLFDRYQNLLNALLIGAIVFGGMAFVLGRPPAATITIIPPPPTATPAPTLVPSPTSTPEPIQVYVTGEVRFPEQTVTIPFGSRAIVAIEASGGTTDQADLTRVNIAQILRDGDQVHVFALSDEGSNASEVVLATPVDSGIVYVNTATCEELEQLPHVGPAIAERILAYRDAHGYFETLDDLALVNGVGPATLEDIAPFVSLEIR